MNKNYIKYPTVLYYCIIITTINISPCPESEDLLQAFHYNHNNNEDYSSSTALQDFKSFIVKFYPNTTSVDSLQEWNQKTAEQIIHLQKTQIEKLNEQNELLQKILNELQKIREETNNKHSLYPQAQKSLIDLIIKNFIVGCLIGYFIPPQ